MSNSGYQLLTDWVAKCANHTHAAVVDARGLHGLACRKSAPRQQRHSHLNDIVWCAMNGWHVARLQPNEEKWRRRSSD